MRFLAFFFLFFVANSFSQDKNPGVDLNQKLPQTVRDTVFYSKIDSLYREDQFYFSVTYNLFQQKPQGFSQNGFSTGLSLGFLRDMPINKKRTFAIAAGLGISYSKYHQNLFVSETNGTPTYEILDNVSYDRNKLEQVFVDFPLEVRWRNSSPESHKFWRIYTGFRVRYSIFNKTTFDGDSKITVFNNKDFDKIQYGPYIAFGYNTWNFHAYYGLNPLFKSAEINGEKIKITTLNLGLMFYIL